MQRTLASLVFAAISAAAFADPATVVYQDRVTEVANAAIDKGDLWLAPEDLAKATGFVLKPEGACLDEICVPVKEKDAAMLREADGKKLLNVSALARKLGQAVATDDEAKAFSFGPIPAIRAAGLESGVAPDFELPDLEGKTHRLSDYRGKKVMILTWASW